MTTPFEIAERYVDDVTAQNPVYATYLGTPGHDHEWGVTFSTEGMESMLDLSRRLRAEMEPHLDHPDPTQRLAAQVAIGKVMETEEGYEAGDHFRDVRHLASSFQQLTMIFQAMKSETAEDWSAIRSRLSTIDQPLEDYRRRLDEGRARGITVARRQVEAVTEQARHLSGDASAFNGLLHQAEASGHRDEDLESAASHARSSFGEFGEWLSTVYLPDAVEADGAGEEQYRRATNELLGLRIDPAEAYAWGWQELQRLLAEMATTAERIIPGADVKEVRTFLESEPSEMAQSPQGLVDYVRGLLLAAVDDLTGEHFDVPDAIKPLSVELAPPGGALGAYYMPPSEDFSRPGGVWYSVGDRTEFPLYSETSTAYHEGFPGHHLQIATAMYRKENLSRVQRLMTFYPGYSEGWGMYAEVLMGELGYLEDPKHYFGMLSTQMMRASRVVVDIGLHLGYPIDPASTVAPGQPWDFENAVEFMQVYGFQDQPVAVSEVLRYLGWPGQAITYKLGEREILSIRQEAKDRLGSSFNLKKFHATVVDNGAMRLDLLREVVAERLR